MRTPDLTIGPRDNPQTLRWHIFRWRGWQLALHKWCRSDDDRALHDHSADNLSLILSAPGYYEVTGDEHGTPIRGDYRRPWRFHFRRAELPHRIALLDSRPVWTLWLRWPPRREWGFWCPKAGWRHWREYVAERDYSVPGSSSTVGKGCG